MSLTYDDLQAIRTIVEETVNPLRGDIEALSNDIKDISVGSVAAYRDAVT